MMDIGIIILLLLVTIILVASIYVKINLALTNFEEILFYSLSMKVMFSHGDSKPIIIAIKRCIPFIIIIFILLYLIFISVNIPAIDSNTLIIFIREHHKIIITILLVLSLCLLLNSVGFFNYLHFYIRKSKLIKENYVDPKKTQISFNKKRNVIVIFVESLENSLFTKGHGGAWNKEIIPDLYNMLNEKESVSFYNPVAYTGMYMLQSSSYTSSSVFTNNSGVPVKIGLDRKGYTKKKYMGGVYNLGDLLKDHGYHNELISAANTTYGSFKDYFINHGNYNIIDVDNLDEYGIKITKKDKCNWGFNDRCLFEVAKKRLDTLSKEKKPFNMQLITIDTHFVDGYIGEYSETKFKKQYENAYATTSKLIKNFIDYVKKQSYYKNTTIVIVGDHLIMQSDFMNDKMLNNRTVYNCFINTANKEIINKKRTYTALDLYPTIISAMGAKIKGDRLALGVNLFSNKKTLAEKYGVKKLNNELKKTSKYYDEIILQKKKR